MLEHTNQKQVLISEGSVETENVYFSYTSKRQNLLNNEKFL